MQERGILYLIGGGEEAYNSWSDELYLPIVELTNHGKIAIINYEDDEFGMDKYLTWLGAKTARTFILRNREDANSSELARELKTYDAIFLEGGHQRFYYQTWKNTAFAKILFYFYSSGKLIAGTSAGAMLLSEISFLSKAGRIHPDQIFLNPFLDSIELKSDFLNFMPGTIIDSHFNERGRLLRLVPLMAGSVLEFHSGVTGIGIDEETALLIKPDFTGEVMGNNQVTILKPTSLSNIQIESPKHALCTNIEYHSIGAGMKYDFKNQIIKIPDENTKFHVLPLTRADSLFFNSQTFLANNLTNLLIRKEKMPDQIVVSDLKNRRLSNNPTDISSTLRLDLKEAYRIKTEKGKSVLNGKCHYYYGEIGNELSIY